jgi:hypothetical protein
VAGCDAVGVAVKFERFQLADVSAPAPTTGVPTLVEVRCHDTVSLGAGGSASSRVSTMYLRAPADWVSAPLLEARVLREVRLIYDATASRASAPEDTRYQLTGIEARALEPGEAPAAGAPVYGLGDVTPGRKLE